MLLTLYTCLFQTGSAEEREVAIRVHNFSTARDYDLYDLKLEDEIDVDISPPDDATIGADFSVAFLVRNKIHEKREVKVTATIFDVFYTGVIRRRVKGETYNIELDSGEGNIFHFSPNQCMIKLSLLTASVYIL